MPVTIDIHQPVLVNTLGHSAGVFIFGSFLYLFLRDRRRARLQTGLLPAAAAVLALLWNAGSVLVLASSHRAGPAAFSVRLLIAGSFSALSLLPAVLLQLSLSRRYPWIWRSGYAISAAAVALHFGELFDASNASLHQEAVNLISAGFGILTGAAIVALVWKGNRSETPRVVGAMALFLIAISFVHFGAAHGPHALSGELAIHHGGIPLAVLVLLQEYRFLLLDVFVRLLANATLASVFILAAVSLNERFDVLRRASAEPFSKAMLAIAVCVGLMAFASARSLLQRAMTRIVFRRSETESAMHRIMESGASAASSQQFLEAASGVIAGFLHVEQHMLAAGDHDMPELFRPEPVNDPSRWGVTSGAPWAEAIVPLRFSLGDAQFLLLGRRKGGRRYLSEDFDTLRRMAAVIVDQVERIRSADMRRLVSQAELRALQAQINPHFLFNSLNALYGVIPRQAEGARQTVLNLAQIFRYVLQSDKTCISLAEELKIVRAYLDIETLRLGDRLRTEIEVDPEVLSTEIPALSLQPLVENAIKHGVAAKPGPGWVRVQASQTQEGVLISVADSGGTFPRDDAAGNRMGLDNVRQRLKLYYGHAAELAICADAESTVVSFTALQVRPAGARS